MSDYPSHLLEQAVEAFNSLPGIGRRTALRLALHMLRQSKDDVQRFADSISTFREEVKHCRVCHNISDNDICDICSDPKRDTSTICVVQNVQDVMAIENTRQYKGLYHVLGGIISPMDGIGPSDLFIDSLVERVAGGEVKEVIMALSSVADTSIIPMQDLLHLDNSARINHPSTQGCNWMWRMRAEDLSDELLHRLQRLTSLYGRGRE